MNAKAKRCLAMGISEEFRPRLSWAEASALTGGPAAPQGAPVVLGACGSTDKALDPATTKALLCERISAALGVRICRLVKLAGKEPTFRMELEGTKAEFLTVRRLMSQSAVREAIAASKGKIIRKFKGKDWDQLAQAMLDACFIEHEENQREGAARMYVAHYLAETGFLDTLEGQQVQNLRKPIVLHGKVAICASDLQMYVNKTMLQILSVKAVSSMLRALGGKSIRVRGQKFKEQGRWVLPLDQFDPTEYSQRKTEEDARDAI